MTNRSVKPLVARGLDIPVGPIKAPESIVLWTPGLVRGDFPTNIWDGEAARAVMAAYTERGNPIPIDIEHGTNPTANPQYDPAKPPPGGGYSGLELDASGALVLRPIRWSDYARAEIESGSRCAVSPDWDYDPATGRPTRLKKVSLVQNPGTYGIGLVASARSTTAKGTPMDTEALQTALKAIMSIEDPAVMKSTLQSLIAELEAAPAEPVMVEEPMAETAQTQEPPMDREAAIAAARSALAGLFGKAKGSVSAAATGGASREEVLRLAKAEGRAAGIAAFREESTKAALIASATGSPAMTPAFARELGHLPLTAVAKLIKTLPPPLPSADAAALAAATASAATGAQSAAPAKVSPSPLPGPAHRTEPEPTAKEQVLIQAIQDAGKSGRQRIAAAKASAAETSAEGSATFSAFAQMTGAAPTPALIKPN